MIRASIYGRVGNDPTTRTTRNGKMMVTASIAVDVARPGEEAPTEWLSVAAFGRAGDELARHQKGDLISVRGGLYRSSFVGRDGQERTSWSLTADAVISARTVRPSGGRRQSPSTISRSSAQTALPSDSLHDL